MLKERRVGSALLHCPGTRRDGASHTLLHPCERSILRSSHTSEPILMAVMVLAGSSALITCLPRAKPNGCSVGRIPACKEENVIKMNSFPMWPHCTRKELRFLIDPRKYPLSVFHGRHHGSVFCKLNQNLPTQHP